MGMILENSGGEPYYDQLKEVFTKQHRELEVKYSTENSIHWRGGAKSSVGSRWLYFGGQSIREKGTAWEREKTENFQKVPMSLQLHAALCMHEKETTLSQRKNHHKN